MAKIDFKTNTTQFTIENAPPEKQENTRGYLGMSGLGGSCTRKTWLGWRFASPKIIDPRSKRIFERGDLEEKRIITDLKKFGMEVFRRDDCGNKFELTGEVGEEQEHLVGFAGHAAGHPDGRVIGVIEAPKTEHLLEIKTMNDARWKKCEKDGVKVSDPTYYSQVNRYMERMDLRRCLFISTNKNDERRLYERIKFDQEESEKLIRLEQDIITSDVPHGQKFKRSWFECRNPKFSCAHFDVCHNDKAPVKTCRSCEHVDLATEGKWLCGLNNDKDLTLAEQLKACPSYKRSF